MLEIKIVTDRTAVAEICAGCGIFDIERLNVMAAFDSGRVIAFTVFTMDRHSLTIERIEPQDDLPLADGMVRSTLHIAAERGLEKAYYTDSVDEEFLKRFRFVKNAQQKELDIGILFTDCGCHQ